MGRVVEERWLATAWLGSRRGVGTSRDEAVWVGMSVRGDAERADMACRYVAVRGALREVECWSVEASRFGRGLGRLGRER